MPLENRILALTWVFSILRRDLICVPRLVIVGELSAARAAGLRALFEETLVARAGRGLSVSGVGRRGHDCETAGQVACTDAARACPWCHPFRVTAGTDI